MKNFVRTFIKSTILIVAIAAFSMTLSAQDNDAYETAKKEIVQQFGSFLSLFEVFPEHALPGAWDNFKQLQSPENAIPPKYRELMQLAVASQIPCDYCIYYHVAVAKAFGATDEEIKEAVAHGAQTRQWSMVLQGNQIEIEDFKAEVDAALIYMSEQAAK